MFGIIAINRGRGITAWVQHDGKLELYPTREAAEAAADRYNSQQGPIDRFTDYFAEEYK